MNRCDTHRAVLPRVLFGTLIAELESDMEDREQKFGTNDMGLIVFVVVAIWLIFQSSLF